MQNSNMSNTGVRDDALRDEVSRASVDDTLDTRVAMLKTRIALPAETERVMTEIREAIAVAAQRIVAEIDHSKVKYDHVRLIAALDMCQYAMNIACDAVYIPHHKVPL